MYNMSNISRLQIKDFKAYKDKVFVTDLEHGETLTKAGLIVTDDNMTNRGIRPRWGKVWAIGSNVKDVEVGQWILIDHGRWTQRIRFDIDDTSVDVWSVEYPKSVFVVSDEDPRGHAFAPHKPGYEFATRKLG